MAKQGLDWWEQIGQMRWQHVLLLIVAIAGFVALCFAPSCNLTIDSRPTPTTTTVRP